MANQQFVSHKKKVSFGKWTLIPNFLLFFSMISVVISKNEILRQIGKFAAPHTKSNERKLHCFKCCEKGGNYILPLSLI